MHPPPRWLRLAVAEADLSRDLDGAPIEEPLRQLDQIHLFEDATELRREPVDELGPGAIALLSREVDPVLGQSVAECLPERLLWAIMQLGRGQPPFRSLHRRT